MKATCYFCSICLHRLLNLSGSIKYKEQQEDKINLMRHWQTKNPRYYYLIQDNKSVGQITRWYTHNSKTCCKYNQLFLIRFYGGLCFAFPLQAWAASHSMSYYSWWAIEGGRDMSNSKNDDRTSLRLLKAASTVWAIQETRSGETRVYL